ncbi:hypothetical protein [Pseudomonas putida]|uniref:hypothetical protein n=1 Tax=Pseudomonas putida TaxID=303 RepID=UPI001110BA8B|nr:hypothetical protein [Pseudomonas putida]
MNEPASISCTWPTRHAKRFFSDVQKHHQSSLLMVVAIDVVAADVLLLMVVEERCADMTGC